MTHVRARPGVNESSPSSSRRSLLSRIPTSNFKSRRFVVNMADRANLRIGETLDASPRDPPRRIPSRCRQPHRSRQADSPRHTQGACTHALLHETRKINAARARDERDWRGGATLFPFSPKTEQPARALSLFLSLSLSSPALPREYHVVFYEPRRRRISLLAGRHTSEESPLAILIPSRRNRQEGVGAK